MGETIGAQHLSRMRETLAALVCPGSVSDGAGVSAAEMIDQLDQLRAVQAAASAAIAAVSVRFAKTQVRAAETRGATLEQKKRSATAELALALRVSPVAAGRRLEQHRRLIDAMPATLALLTAGETSDWAVGAVLRATAGIPDEHTRQLDEHLAPDLSALKPDQAAGRSRRFIQQLDPAAAAAKLRMSARQACVTVRPVADGMARLSILTPTSHAIGMYATLHRTAQTAGPDVTCDETGEPKTRGMVMADLAYTAITGATHPARQPVEIQLVMTADTLFGGDAPAQIGAGATTGTIPAPLARQLAFGPDDDAHRWIRRLFTDPATGTLTDLDATRRYFTGTQRRYIQLRDQYCTTPWCGAPIRDIDHAQRFTDGGRTDPVNGNGKCQACNHTKELPGWETTGRQHGAIHEVEITTPHGKRYTSHAPPVLPSIYGTGEIYDVEGRLEILLDAA